MLSVVEEFVSLLNSSLSSKSFVKLSVSNPRDKDFDLRKFTLQLVEVQKELKLKCVYTHKTKDITKNYSFNETVTILSENLGVHFKNAILYSTESDYNILFNKKMKGRIMKQKATFDKTISISHNKTKQRFIKTKNNSYLVSLGVVDKLGHVNKNMEDKYKQINKYIETVDGILKSSDLKSKTSINIVDMGSGKGYLTFALYDYFTNTLNKKTQIIGVEQRPDLVNLCNSIAKENNYTGLSFNKGSIDSFKTEKIDILIALHACDTATDDAIFNGIKSKASVIITAPCCHKQVRKQLNIDNELKEITQFGILEERQAEILTDTIRALVLESEGYNSQVFEFIADAHTHKNVMVVGTKKKSNPNAKQYLEKIEQLKTKFGIDFQQLEKKIKDSK